MGVGLTKRRVAIRRVVRRGVVGLVRCAARGGRARHALAIRRRDTGADVDRETDVGDVP
jgi:hypothetical protein